MDAKLFTNALPLGSFFVHDFQFFPLRKVTAPRRMTEDSSTIRVNLTWHAVGFAGLPQNFQIAIKAFIFCKVQPGDFSRGIINPARETIALVVTELIEPRERSTVHLHQIALAIPTQTRPVNFLFLFHAVRLRRDQAVLLHNFTESSQRNVDAFKLRKTAAEVRKINVRVMAGIKQRDPLRQRRVRFVFWNTATVPVFKQRIPQERILLLEDTQMLTSIPSRLRSLAQGVLPIVKTFNVQGQNSLVFSFRRICFHSGCSFRLVYHENFNLICRQLANL